MGKGRDPHIVKEECDRLRNKDARKVAGELQSYVTSLLEGKHNPRLDGFCLFICIMFVIQGSFLANRNEKCSVNFEKANCQAVGCL